MVVRGGATECSALQCGNICFLVLCALLGCGGVSYFAVLVRRGVVVWCDVVLCDYVVRCEMCYVVWSGAVW